MVYQLGSGMLDTFVLAIISRQDTYGYLISQEIKKVIDLKESTLYPVLRRLQEAGYLDTYDQPFQGRNRKYYHITREGAVRYEFYLKEWEKYQILVESIIKGGKNDDEE